MLNILNCGEFLKQVLVALKEISADIVFFLFFQ